MNRKYKFIIFIIVAFIYTGITFLYIDDAIEITFTYKAESSGAIQVFYDTKLPDGPVFDANNTIIKEFFETKDEFKKLSFKIKKDRLKKLRFDIRNSKGKVYIKNIDLTLFGIPFKRYSEEEIVRVFSKIQNADFNVKNKILEIEEVRRIPTLDSAVFSSTNTRSNYKLITIFAIFVITVITLLTYIVILKIMNFLNIRIKINYFNEKLLIGMLIGFIILPTILYPFFPANLKQNNENRALKSKPMLQIENIQSYPKKYEEYYSDRLPFKNQIVRLNSLAKYKLFNISPVNYVIKGKDDWLFYDSKFRSDRDTIGDYQGTNRYTKKELEDIALDLEEKREIVEENGGKFYYVVLPNKSQVYSEFMPDEIYKTDEPTRVDELVDYLRKNTKINVIYPKEILIKAKEKYKNFNLYKKLDTHWSEVGAYIGFKEIMEQIDKDNNDITLDIPDLNELSIKSETLYAGDLVRMINLEGLLKDTKYTVPYKEDIIVDNPNLSGEVYERYRLNKESTPEEFSEKFNDKKLLMYRDSFAIDMIPFMKKEFGESIFLRKVSFNENHITNEKPDIVIMQYVERSAGPKNKE